MYPSLVLWYMSSRSHGASPTESYASRYADLAATTALTKADSEEADRQGLVILEARAFSLSRTRPPSGIYASTKSAFYYLLPLRSK